MAYKPVMRSEKDEISDLVKGHVSKLDEKIDDLSKSIANMKPKASMEDIIQKMKDKAPNPDTIKKPEESHIHNDVSCPTCGKHVHKMVGNDLALTCEDGKCGAKVLLIPSNADHVCKDCGFPLKSPPEGKSVEACPSCGGVHALQFDNGKAPLKFDFNKMKKNK